MARPRKAAPEIARSRTDHGLTGDKVAAPDPAAVPLSGDAEAAGTPTAGDAARASAARQQAMQAKRTAQPAPFSANRDPAGHGRRLWWAVAIVVLLVLAGLIAGWTSLSGL